MAWTQYSTGVSYAILKNTSQELSYVKQRTVLSVRKSLKECQAKLHLDTPYIQYSLRKKDIAIMDLVNTQTTYKMSTNQKEKLNCVRMYLGVQYVRQINTVNGTNFVPGILDGDNSQLCSQTNLTKFHQERPGKHSWQLWQRILKLLTVSSRKLTNKLKEKLGKWIDDHNEYGGGCGMVLLVGMMSGIAVCGG